MSKQHSEKELTATIRRINSDLETTFTEIKRSEQFLKYKTDPFAMSDIILNVVSSFAIQQMYWFTAPMAIVNNETGHEFTRAERLISLVNKFATVFEHDMKQFISYIEEVGKP